MRLLTSCDITFDIPTATPFILMLRPRSGAQQWIAREEFTLLPQIPVHEFSDDYGNFCQRLLAPGGRLAIHTAAEVHISDIMPRKIGAPFVEVQNLPNETLKYLLPSRYCQSEHFGELAADITMGCTPGYDQVSAIESWIRSSISYDFTSSEVLVSALEVCSRKWGVCRDFSHLGIALCRSLSIPARMVVGFLHMLTPMNMHAWFEAYLAGHWYTFDATQPFLRSGYVILGIGRDAADVAVYNQFGPPVFPTEQHVQVEHLEDTQWTT